MIQEEHRSVSEIAERVQVSPSYLYTMLRAYRNTRVHEAIDEGLIPSRRMLMEVSRVITNNGEERLPGIVERALQYLGGQHPTYAAFRRTLESWLLNPDLPDSPARASRRSGQNVEERERQHIQALVRPLVVKDKREELERLLRVYEETTEDLRRLTAERALTSSAKPSHTQ